LSALQLRAKLIMNFFSGVHCSKCNLAYPGNKPINLCKCGAPLLAQYDLETARNLDKHKIRTMYRSIWDLAPLLPVQDKENMLNLGEGNTPLLIAENLGDLLGLDYLYIKDEALNPTGSFKARGICLAVSKANELGIKDVCIPTAGNAGGALAAYAALAGMTAHVVMPEDTPQPFIDECKLFGADVILIDGVISDCSAYLTTVKEQKGWFDISTLKEPYRLEGKKTMGYELAFQFDWELPDVIIYPLGGGTGLIGMWKAFNEMETMGWIGWERPRMVAVQPEGCAPIVRAFHAGEIIASQWENPSTIALGLRVPQAIGDFLILKIIYESRGAAIAVSDMEIKESLPLLASKEGVLACPEGAATVAAVKKLKQQDLIRAKEKIVLFNTGSIYKYLDLI